VTTFYNACTIMNNESVTPENFIHPCVTSSSLLHIILLSTVFPNTINLCP